jgi:hypothetical protein
LAASSQAVKTAPLAANCVATDGTVLVAIMP